MAETELNSVTDNPIVISDEEKQFLVGNFHVQLMALPVIMRLWLLQDGNISDSGYLLLGKYGLPKLRLGSGLNSGFMIPPIYYCSVGLPKIKQLCFQAEQILFPEFGTKDHISV